MAIGMWQEEEKVDGKFVFACIGNQYHGKFSDIGGAFDSGMF